MKGAWVRNMGHQGAGEQRTDTRDLGQSAADFTGARMSGDAPVHLLDLTLDQHQLLREGQNTSASQIWDPLIPLPDHRHQLVGPLPADPGH
jgi:hypothetical protein